MKKLLLITIILNTLAFGQVSADLTIENQEVLGTDFYFDMYLTRTLTSNVYLGTADFVLTFNSSAFTNPVITRESVTYWNLSSSSGNPVGSFYRTATSPAVITGNELIINLDQVFFGDQTDFDNNIAQIDNTPLTHKIGRYKISGINNPADSMYLQWKTTSSGVTTQVFTFVPVSPWVSTLVNINAINPPNVPLNSNPITFQLSVSYNDGWNMVSVPGVNPEGMGVNTWWEHRDLGANVFLYAGGYQVVTITTPGTGYWMKHAGARTYNTGDEWPAGGINIVSHSPINANAGWNLIGGYEYNAAVSGITTTPPGLQDSPVFGYSSGYQIVDYLIPGYGYWIKLSAPGSINLPSSMQKNNTDEIIKKDWGKLIFTDASGKSFTLYSVEGDINLDYYELPPPSPSEMFDIRFRSGRLIEDLHSAMKSIELIGITYPLTVHVENTEVRIQDETGKIINSILKAGEEISVHQNLSRMLVTTSNKPEKYSLEQNYPNPFNPSTNIEFSIPEDVSNAALTIYNSLGQKIAELVNSKLAAGKYNYVWNANDVATGLYIYELKTDKYIFVKKMILLK